MVFRSLALGAAPRALRADAMTLPSGKPLAMADLELPTPQNFSASYPRSLHADIRAALDQFHG